jgi:hypothetical protein
MKGYNRRRKEKGGEEPENRDGRKTGNRRWH